MSIPYVIGQWVSGPRFYGREPLLDEILRGGESRLWLAGLRRIGKTSLLRQAETRAPREGKETGRPILPLYWDLQGAMSERDLALAFGEALLEAEETLAAFGVETGEAEDEDPGAAIEKLGRAARRAGATLLLLCDEADALLDLAASDRELPARLWRALDEGEGARAVLASSLRLADLGLDPQSRRTVPGLGATFGAPRLFGLFKDDEARTLLRQDHLPEAERPPLREAEVEAIREAAGNHPMLLQLAAKRFLELCDLDEALRQVEADRSVQHLFAVDFELLSEAEREALASISGNSREGRCDAPTLRRLLALGQVRDGGDGLFSIPNRFLALWLRGQKLNSA